MDNNIDDDLKRFLDYLKQDNLGGGKRSELIYCLDRLEHWVDRRGPLPRWPLEISITAYHDLKIPREQGQSVFRAECIVLLARMHTTLDLESREGFVAAVRAFKSWCIRALDE